MGLPSPGLFRLCVCVCVCVCCVCVVCVCVCVCVVLCVCVCVLCVCVVCVCVCVRCDAIHYITDLRYLKASHLLHDCTSVIS